MSFFIKKIRPVFSPFLSSFGGGSARGFAPGGVEKVTTVTGESSYTTAGTYSWTAPAGVYAVDVVCVGGAGGSGCHGSGGAGLGWKNQIPVTPGTSYTVVVGNGGQCSGYQGANNGEDGEDSYFISATTVKGGKSLGTTVYQTSTPAYGSQSNGGTYVGDGGGNGGNGGESTNSSNGAGGGGAGGYSGNGGDGGDHSGWTGGGGGGVGLFGEGSNGSGGTPNGSAGSGGGGGGGGGQSNNGGPGGGGSGGNSGSSGSSAPYGVGGAYGGGAGGANTSAQNYGRTGGGAVRIMYGPPGTRSFPNDAA